jgi:hypothetical protein
MAPKKGYSSNMHISFKEFSHQITKLANTIGGYVSTIAAFPVAYVFRAARILQL